MSRSDRLAGFASLATTCLMAASPEAMARLRADVEVLAAPAMQGRGSGQDGMLRAARWAEARFRSLGLAVDIQEVPFEHLRLEQADACLCSGTSRRRLVLGRDLECFKQPMDLELQGRPLVYVGCGVSHPAHEELAGLDVKGKVALMEAQVPETVRKALPPEACRLLPRLQALADRGVSLVLLGSPTRGLGRLGRFSQPLPVPAGLLFTGCLEGPAATLLAEARQRLTCDGKPASRALPITLDIRLKQSVVPVFLPNVVATLKGRDPRLGQEHVVVGAHLDHLGTLPAANGGQDIFPGADDNASGCAGVLELARRLARQPVRRAVIFILFAGEEQGLLGSTHWVRHPTVPLPSVRGMLNLDCIGRLDLRGEGLGMTMPGHGEADRCRFQALAPAGLKLHPDPGTSPMARMSDHAPFAAAGIPSIGLFTGLHADLHQTTDRAERLDYAAMADITAFALALARELGDRP